MLDRGSPGDGDSAYGVHVGDARNTDAFLEAFASKQGLRGPFLQTTITSPPYANLVDYGVDGQIGFRQDYDTYLDECRKIFKSVANWTRSTGTLWVVADSLVVQQGRSALGALVPLPFDLARSAAEAGWVLREVIVWHKDRTRPWASPGRLRNGFEYVLMFAKETNYTFNISRLRDHSGLKSWWIKYPERHNPWGMTPENVWEIPIPLQGSWASDDLRHACPFPVELVRRMIELSTEADDVVFDPFAGSGMVAAVANANGRRALGTELNPEFVKAYHSRVIGEVEKELGAPSDLESSPSMTENLLKLRLLKYPKELMRSLLRADIKRSEIVAAEVSLLGDLDLEPHDPPYFKAEVVLVVDTATRSVAAFEDLVLLARKKAPLSKFSVEMTVKVVQAHAFIARDESSVYRNGRTWRSASTVREGQDLGAFSHDDFPPIYSSTSVDLRPEE